LYNSLARLGVVVCFINDGRVGCYEEDDIINGKKEVDEIVDVKWGEDSYKARVVFVGK